MRSLFFLLAMTFFSGNAAFALEECTLEADQALQEWLTKNPGEVGLFSLYRGYSIGNQESRYISGKPGSDKRNHCFVGCRIAFEVNLETALYAGWYKEERDLTDCDLSTHFDPSDEAATRKGAEAGAQLQRTGSLEENRQSCLQACR